MIPAMQALATTLITSLLLGALATDTSAAPEALQRVRANGVELHYLARGQGEPIVFVHGGLSDYREWAPVAESLADRYRTITYSRRYNHPNDNPVAPNHSAVVEADDLAALLRELRLGRAHVVGVSYGALTALHLGLRHPELVRSLVLVEPPLMRWLPDLPGGAPVYDRFMATMWNPTGRAFREGKPDEALRLTVEYFIGPGAGEPMPAELRAALLPNLREWQALTTSADALTYVKPADVRRLKRPVLVVTGERTYDIAKILDPELARLLPSARRTIISEGTHEMCTEHPDRCADAIRSFLGRLETRPAP
jgi:pimeloyl-ACP methyl ester carboxylesterase